MLGAGAIPVVLGGDHAITEPSVRACAAVHGPVGMIHFDTHTDTGAEVFGVEISHGTFIRRLVDEGAIDPARYAQIGLRGYWPGEAEFAWQAERGITSLFAHDVRDLGIREVVRRAIEAVGPRPGVPDRRRRRPRPRVPRRRDRHARARRHDARPSCCSRSAPSRPRST